MRINPFSKGIGRRRAAMTQGNPSEMDDGLPGDDRDDDAGTRRKSFGFTNRPRPDTEDDARENDVTLNGAGSEDYGRPDGYDGAEGGARSGDDDDFDGQHWPEPYEEAPPRDDRMRRSPTASPGEAAVHPPHIERLRAQIGDEAASAMEPWISDEPRRRPPTNGDAGQFEPDEPLGQTAFHDDSAAPLPVPAPRSEPAPPAPAQREIPPPEDSCSDQSEEAVETAEAAAKDIDPMEDVAVTIGRVVSISGSVIWGALFDDIDGHAARMARMGALVSMRGPESRVFGIVNRLEREQQAGNAQSERTIFEIQILGEIADDRTGFQRGVSSFPPLDAPVTTITIRDIATIYARPRSSNIHIGQLRHNPKVPAFVLTDSLLGKHFAVLGTTGTGKSCATTVILRSILDEHPKGHIVLIDPHNEYGAAFADRAELLNPRNLQLPYWLLNFEEIAHVILGSAGREQVDGQRAVLKNAIIQAKALFNNGQDSDPITVDTPLPYRLSDLVRCLKDGMGMLNKAEGSSLYLGLINRIENLSSDKRYAFMFSSLSLRDNMQQIMAQILRIPTDGKPMTIIDISGLPSEVVDVVVSVLFRLTFELAVWSERGKAPPVLLVCEEAHRYVPEESDGAFAPTKRVIAQIAKEGRKYGVTLCLVSQRPSELAVNSLAQCNTVFALRLANEHDQAFVSQALSENARWLVDSLPSLNTQEAVVVGDGVTVPVHIRFRDLTPAQRPASHDPSFARSWSQEADDSFLEKAIDRWRRQAR